MALASDATIRSTLSTISNPPEYIRIVVGNMFLCKKKHGNALVRIGITGTGKMPFHRISYIDEAGTELLFRAFDGVHPFEGVVVHENTWSSKSDKLDEVQELLGEVRSLKNRPRAM